MASLSIISTPNKTLGSKRCGMGRPRQRMLNKKSSQHETLLSFADPPESFVASLAAPSSQEEGTELLLVSLTKHMRFYMLLIIFLYGKSHFGSHFGVWVPSVSMARAGGDGRLRGDERSGAAVRRRRRVQTPMGGTSRPRRGGPRQNTDRYGARCGVRRPAMCSVSEQ